MARPSTSDRVKLDRLRRARPKAEALARGTILDAKPMAELIGTQWSTLRDWIDAAPELEGKGALIRGGNGVLWKIKPLRTVDMLIKRFEKSVETQAARNRKVRRAIGVQLPDSEADASHPETEGMVKMTIAVFTAKEKQGYYVPAAAMAAFLGDYNRVVTSAILGVKTKADPNGNLPPHIRASVDEYLRGVASQVHAQAEKFVKESLGASSIRPPGAV